MYINSYFMGKGFFVPISKYLAKLEYLVIYNINQPMSRENIPAELKRKILVEAGHRCAIPTCRFPTTELAHIVPYSKVLKHEYHNLIALCPNCHTRFDKGEIDRKSMDIYKNKLVFLSDKYSKYELDVLEYLRKENKVIVYGHLSIKNLVDNNLT